jgi:cyclase
MTNARADLFYAVLLAVAATALADERIVPAKNAAGDAAVVPGLTYRFEKVTEGVFCAIAEGVPYYVANSAVIIGNDGVMIVDTGSGPNEARVLLDGIRKITDRPVRYVVDTHFHLDHAYGSEVFAGALIIGHEITRELLGPDALSGRTAAGNISRLPARIAEARAEAEKEASDEKRAELERRADALEAYRKEMISFVPVQPQLTFNEQVTVWLGDREARIMHLGRGHTAGDVVVYLPEERIVCTGDIYNGYIGYMGDGYVDEWADSLDRLAALDFETVIPGHGMPFKGTEMIAPVQACLRDLWRQAEELKRAGVTADKAAARIDLRAHASRFPRLSKVGIEAPAVRRIYEVIDARQAVQGR